MRRTQPFFLIFLAKPLKKYQKNGSHDIFRFHFGEISHKIKTLLWIDINIFKKGDPQQIVIYFFQLCDVVALAIIHKES